MGYRIERSHEICAGHRVVGHEGRCRNLHGHAYVVSFVCEAATLDEIGRVIDFAVIKSALCQWLEDNWDHRMLLWAADPLYPALHALDPTVLAVPFNPTAENLARYLVDEVGPERLRGSGVRLTSARVQETGKCSAIFEAES